MDLKDGAIVEILIIDINLSMLIMVCKKSLSIINTRSNIDTILYFYKTIYRIIVFNY